MTTATTVLNIARSQLGYREGPNNSNKYGRWMSWDNVAYCAIFQSWVFAQAGSIGLIHGKHAYCPYLERDFKTAGQWHSWQATPQRGDLVLYDWSGRHGLAQHVGIVESYDPNYGGVVTSLEANTTSGLAGDQSDGGGVYRRRRNSLYVVGYGRPAYAPERGVRPLPPHADRSTRHALPLLVDGIWGTATTRRVQQWVHAPVDGAYGPATKRALQRALHVTADGAVGPITIKALQRKVGAPTANGVLGRDTVRALQRWLNRNA